MRSMIKTGGQKTQLRREEKTRRIKVWLVESEAEQDGLILLGSDMTGGRHRDKSHKNF